MTVTTVTRVSATRTAPPCGSVTTARPVRQFDASLAGPLLRNGFALSRALDEEDLEVLPGGGLTSAEAAHESPYGRIESGLKDEK